MTNCEFCFTILYAKRCNVKCRFTFCKTRDRLYPLLLPRQTGCLCLQSVYLLKGGQNMAEVQLKNIKKVYPFVSGEQKKEQEEKS